jgi:thiol-disulfide isomerase/thioredoxin
MHSLTSRRMCVAFVLALAFGPSAMARTPGEVEVGSVLRDAVMRGLNGPDRKLSDYRGKPLVINVWASWCPPCLQEMASLVRLAWSEAGQKFTVIGISTDDYADAAKARLIKNSATLNHYIDYKLELENMLGADHLPLTLLVDAKGRVVSKTTGAREWDSDASKAMINKAFRITQATKP